MEIRTRIGYDIHKLEEGRKFVLGNVTIPFEKGFIAHSDGDVLIHAIIDALLGAIAYGDIGRLFPDNDDSYKNIDSSILLRRVKKIVKEKGYKIGNIDTIIICQKPKLMPYIDKIRENLSSILEIEIDKISVKAKTKEGMDATGKGDSVEVFASTLIFKEM